MTEVARALGPRSVEPLFGVGGDRSAQPTVGDHPDLEVGAVWSLEVSPSGWKPVTELASPGSARAELWEIAKEFGANPSYPETVLAESARAVANPGFETPGLRDLRQEPFVTIDNEDSRDLDQAMCLKRSGDGFTVLYALADAAYYVPPDSALFREALRRGASYYFPAFAIPMLPPPLSEGLISLNPGVDRRALVLEMDLDSDGLCRSTKVYQALIHSHAKLAYDGVQGYYDAPQGNPHAGQPFTETLDLLARVGQLRIADAERRNVVRYNRIGVSVGFTDSRGARFRAFAEVRNDCEKYNEQISLLCNIEGAHLLLDAVADPTAQPVFRVHPSPPPDRLQALSALIEALIQEHQLPHKLWRWRPGSDESLSDYLRRLPIAGPQVRVARAIERAALLTNLRSTFESEPGPHFGVGAEVYARLSSPMREVVGVFTHKELLEALRWRASGPQDARAPGADEQLRQEVLAAANASKLTQKRITNACNKLVIDHLLSGDLEQPFGKRPSYAATILGVKADRLYLQLDEPPLEVKVYVADIAQVTDSQPTQNADQVAIEGTHRGRPVRWRLGDTIEVKVLDYHRKRQRWMLVPVV